MERVDGGDAGDVALKTQEIEPESKTQEIESKTKDIDAESQAKVKARRGRSVFVQVPPRLPFPLDCITMKTIVPKWLGPIDSGGRWEAIMQRTHDLGYNFIHFAPMQERGISNSPYSIYDQHGLADDLFARASELSQRERFEVLGRRLGELERGLGIRAVIDVVWNHTACNSAWLRDHPEAGYNLDNSPHLKPAYELDEAIAAFSAALGTPNGEFHGRVGALVRSGEELDAVLAVFRHEFLPRWEFFVVEIEACRREVRLALDALTGTEAFLHTPGELLLCACVFLVLIVTLECYLLDTPSQDHFFTLLHNTYTYWM